MTIQRQYISPNCILFLEGFSEETDQGDSGVMSVVTNTRCEIIGCEPKLSGGRDLLENLVKAVNAYAQEFISGITHPFQPRGDSDLIYLRKVTENNHHLLIWQESKDNAGKKAEIELNTIQLLDLVEVIDQFFADNTTLPELTFHLQPVSRRYRQTEETVIEQSTPAIVGILGLTLATFAFFFIPTPTGIKDPNKEQSQPLPKTTNVVPNQPGLEPEPGGIPTPDTQTSPPPDETVPPTEENSNSPSTDETVPPTEENSNSPSTDETVPPTEENSNSPSTDETLPNQ
jgi:hypothetical protein